MSNKTTEQQIRKHIRTAIQEIKNNSINEVDVSGVVTGAAGSAVLRGAATAGGTAVAGTAGGAGAAAGTAGAAAVAVPVAAAVVTALAIAATKEALTQGIFAYKEGANADEKAERNMYKSAVNRAWTASVRRRRADGEESDAGELKQDIAAMRSWRMSRDNTGFDADALSAAIGRITKREWDSAPVEADPGGYGDVEKAQKALDKFLRELPEPPDPVATDPETISEVRKHVRGAINEIMVGLTPIKRMPTQRKANKARKGNNTNTAVDKADIGFNTFDMQEWASIAGIDEKYLSENISDDTGDNSMLTGGGTENTADGPSRDEIIDLIAGHVLDAKTNGGWTGIFDSSAMMEFVTEMRNNGDIDIHDWNSHTIDAKEVRDRVTGLEAGVQSGASLYGSQSANNTDITLDLSNLDTDSADEIPGMVVSAVSGDSDWDDGLEDEVEDLADEYAANQADPDIFDIRDFLAEIRKR